MARRGVDIKRIRAALKATLIDKVSANSVIMNEDEKALFFVLYESATNPYVSEADNIARTHIVNWACQPF